MRKNADEVGSPEHQVFLSVELQFCTRILGEHHDVALGHRHGDQFAVVIVLPAPAAMTLPLVGFSFAVSGRT